jgi:hypothetical protein
MSDVSCIALFCDDIREEKANRETLVGVYPDNVNLPGLPGSFPKICIYLRVNVRLGFDPGKIIATVMLPGNVELVREEVGADVVASSQQKAKDTNAFYAGLKAKIVLSPLKVDQAGRISVIVTAAGKDHIAGALNLRPRSAAES